jgi:hypothetical protein
MSKIFTQDPEDVMECLKSISVMVDIGNEVGLLNELIYTFASEVQQGTGITASVAAALMEWDC